MAKQVAQREPVEGFIGSAWSWDVYHGDFPSDDSWQLSYHLRGPTDIEIAWATEVTAAAAGGGFEIRVPITKTDDLTVPGKHQLIGRVTKAGDDFDGSVVHNSHFLVLANPVTAVGVKSDNRLRLDALLTAQKSQGTKEIVHRVITADARTVEYDDAEYERLVAKYMTLVALEENPHGSLTHATEFVRG